MEQKRAADGGKFLVQGGVITVSHSVARRGGIISPGGVKVLIIRERKERDFPGRSCHVHPGIYSRNGGGRRTWKHEMNRLKTKRVIRLGHGIRDLMWLKKNMLTQNLLKKKRAHLGKGKKESPIHHPKNNP